VEAILANEEQVGLDDVVWRQADVDRRVKDAP
jgi:hypothetical protein